MRLSARDLLVVIGFGLAAATVATHPRFRASRLRRLAGVLRWRVDRHGSFLRVRQQDIRTFLTELVGWCFKESEHLREVDEMLYEMVDDVRNRVELLEH